MSKRVLIIDDSCDPGSLSAADLAPYSDLIALVWFSPAALERLRVLGGVRCHGLLDVVGDLGRWERQAIARMRRVCEAGARHRGFPWRTLVAEGLFREAQLVQAVIDADDLRRRIAGDDPEACDLRVSGATATLFRGLESAAPRPDELQAPSRPTPRAPLPARLARRLRHALLTRDLRGHLWNLLDQLDAGYGLRFAAGRWRRAVGSPGEVVFFSSYLNNSRVLRTLEPWVPDPVRWLVTNYHARAGAAGHRGQLDWLWRFAGSAAVAPVDPAAAEPIVRSFDDPGDRMLATWLAWSPTWSYWRQTGRSSLPRLTAAWETYLERTSPRLVIVANQWGLEGWLTRLARQRDIPVLQLLHGILDGEFYTRQPVVSDALLVWGEFWRDQWPAEERPRIHVCNPPSGIRPVARRPPVDPRTVRPRLTFFSWPFDRIAFCNEAELQDAFADLFHRLLQSGECELTLRAHPLENPADFLGRWRRRHGDLPAAVRLSQREPLDRVLAQTDVAIMFRSTVMLDCFASEIPILLPGWMEFTWQDRLRGIAGVHVARDFDDLLATLRAWIRDPPVIDRAQTLAFLQPAAEDGEEIRRLVADLTARREGP